MLNTRGMGLEQATEELWRAALVASQDALTIDSAVLPLDKMVAIKDACKSRTQSTDEHSPQRETL